MLRLSGWARQNHWQQRLRQESCWFVWARETGHPHMDWRRRVWKWNSCIIKLNSQLSEKFEFWSSPKAAEPSPGRSVWSWTNPKVKLIWERTVGLRSQVTVFYASTLKRKSVCIHHYSKNSRSIFRTCLILWPLRFLAPVDFIAVIILFLKCHSDFAEHNFIITKTVKGQTYKRK